MSMVQSEVKVITNKHKYGNAHQIIDFSVIFFRGGGMKHVVHPVGILGGHVPSSPPQLRPLYTVVTSRLRAYQNGLKKIQRVAE